MTEKSSMSEKEVAWRKSGVEKGGTAVELGKKDGEVSRLDALLTQIKLSLLMREEKSGSENLNKVEELTKRLRSSDAEERAKAQLEANEIAEIFQTKKQEATSRSLSSVVEGVERLEGNDEVEKLVETVNEQREALFAKIVEKPRELKQEEIEVHAKTLEKLARKVGIKENERGLELMEDALVRATGIIEARDQIKRPEAYRSPLSAKAEVFEKGAIKLKSGEVDDGSRLQVRAWKLNKKREKTMEIEDFKTKVRGLHVKDGGEALRKLDGDGVMDWLVEIQTRRADLKSLSGKNKQARDNALESLALLEVEARSAFEQRLRQDLKYGEGSIQEMAMEQVVDSVLWEARGGKRGSGRKLEFGVKYDDLQKGVAGEVKKLERGGVFPRTGYAEAGIPSDPEQFMRQFSNGKKSIEERGALINDVLKKVGIKYDSGLLKKLMDEKNGEQFGQYLLKELKTKGGSGSEMSALRHFIDQIKGNKTGIEKEQARFEDLMDSGKFGKASRHLKSYITKVGLKETSSDFQFAIMLRDAQFRLGGENEDLGEEFEQWQHSTFVPSLKDVTPENAMELMPKVWGASNVNYVFGEQFANAGAMSIELDDGTRKTWSPAVMYQELQSTRASMMMIDADVNKGDSAAWGVVLEYLFGKGAHIEGELVVDGQGNELKKLSDELFVTDFEFASKGMAKGELQGSTREKISIHEILEQSVWMNRRAMSFWMYSGELSEHIAHYPKEQLENTSKWVAAVFRMGHAYSSHFGKITGAYEQIAKSNHMLTELRVYKAGSIVEKTIKDNLMFQEIETVLGGASVDKKKVLLFAKVLTERMEKKIALGGGKYLEEGGGSVTVGMRSREEARLYGNTFGSVEESWGSGLARDWLVAHRMSEKLIPDNATMSSLLSKDKKGEGLSKDEESWVVQAKEFYKLCETMQWSDERSLKSGSGVMMSEKELMENMRVEELAPLVKKRNQIMGGEWNPQNMREFMEGFEFASVMDPSKFFQGSDVLEYSVKYMKAAAEVAGMLPKLQSGRATEADQIEVTGKMRSYLPPEQVDAWWEAFMRIDYRASSLQGGKEYEVAKTNPDDHRTILNRKITDEEGNTFWFVGHDGHRISEKEMYKNRLRSYNGEKWNRKVKTGRDIEVGAAAMSSEGMFPRVVMDKILDDVLGGGKTLDKLLGLEGKTLSEKQVVRRKIAKKMMARSWRLIKRLPLFDDPAWAAWSFGSGLFNLALEAGQEVVSQK